MNKQRTFVTDNVYQWRSHDTVDARAQHGHTTFDSELHEVPK